LKITGASANMEKMKSIKIELHENAIDELVILYNVFPASIAMNEGGATPANVPRTNGNIGTPITGATRLMNQFGKRGVIRRKRM
jgi:hypothetical protein